MLKTITKPAALILAPTAGVIAAAPAEGGGGPRSAAANRSKDK